MKTNLTHETFRKSYAAQCRWLRRKSRQEHPDGEFDKARRWYPSEHDEEVFEYDVRKPSWKWPYSYLLACRSLAHCERYDDATHEEVLEMRKLLRKVGIDPATISTAHVESHWQQVMLQIMTSGAKRTRRDAKSAMPTHEPLRA